MCEKKNGSRAIAVDSLSVRPCKRMGGGVKRKKGWAEWWGNDKDGGQLGVKGKKGDVSCRPITLALPILFLLRLLIQSFSLSI